MSKTVIIGFSIQDGSVSDFFMEIVNEFIKHSYNVIIITDGKRNNLVDKLSNPIILTWPSKRPTKLVDIIFYYKLLKNYKPDIVIGNFASVNIMTTVGYLCNVSKRIAWVHTVSGAFGKANFFKKLRKRLMYTMATNVIANSSAMKEDVKSYYHIKENKIKVFFNAVKVNSVLPVERDINSIIYIGRLHFSKGVDILIEAFSIVVKQKINITLNIIGLGEEENKLKALVKKLKIDKNVNFLGSVQKSEVLTSFASANFAVVPSRKEAFGLVVIEAMSVCTPVIGASTGGIAEIIRDDYDGMLFKNNDSNELSHKIMKMLDNQSLVDGMRSKAFDRVDESFNVKVIAKEFVEYIRID